MNNKHDMVTLFLVGNEILPLYKSVFSEFRANRQIIYPDNYNIEVVNYEEQFTELPKFPQINFKPMSMREKDRISLKYLNTIKEKLTKVNIFVAHPGDKCAADFLTLMFDNMSKVDRNSNLNILFMYWPDDKGMEYGGEMYAKYFMNEQDRTATDKGFFELILNLDLKNHCIDGDGKGLSEEAKHKLLKEIIFFMAINIFEEIGNMSKIVNSTSDISTDTPSGNYLIEKIAYNTNVNTRGKQFEKIVRDVKKYKKIKFEEVYNRNVFDINNGSQWLLSKAFIEGFMKIEISKPQAEKGFLKFLNIDDLPQHSSLLIFQQPTTSTNEPAKFLLRFNKKWNEYFLIGGKQKGNAEKPIQTMRREFEEEEFMDKSFKIKVSDFKKVCAFEYYGYSKRKKENRLFAYKVTLFVLNLKHTREISKILNASPKADDCNVFVDLKKINEGFIKFEKETYIPIGSVLPYFFKKINYLKK